MNSSAVLEYFNKNVEMIHDPDVVEKHLDRAISHAPKFIVLDTETNGFDSFTGQIPMWSHKTNSVSYTHGAQPFSIQIGLYDEKKDKLYCLFLWAEDTWLLAKAKQVIERAKMMVGHNLKFDIRMLRNIGINFHRRIWDSLTATRLTHDRLYKHDLKFLGNFFSGLSGDDSDRWELDVKNWLRRTRAASTRAGNPPDYINYSFVPPEIIIPYALKDIWYSFLIFTLIRDEIEEEYKEIFDLECDIVILAMRMEERGLQIDRKICQQAHDKIKRRYAARYKRVIKAAQEAGIENFNPESHIHVKKLLLQHLPEAELMKKDKKTKQMKISSDAKMLTGLINKYEDQGKLLFLRDLTESRTLSKQDTYYKQFLTKTDGMAIPILHPTYKASDTATGRFACVDPNLQNIPRPIIRFDKDGKPINTFLDGIPSVRSAFVPRNQFYNLYGDYSQIEIVIFSILCQDESLLSAVRAGRDLHTETAIMMLGDDSKQARQKAKYLNFGIIYGMGIEELANQLRCTYQEAKRLMDLYLSTFPNIKRLLSRAKTELATKGYAEDMFGRRYHIPMDRSYIVVNSLVQGASAMLLKVAMIQVRRLLDVLNIGPELGNQINVIHDEQVIELHRRIFCNTLIAMLKRAMEEIPVIHRYGVFPKVEFKYTSTNWEDKQDVKLETCEFNEANRLFKRVYNDVVLNYNVPKVEWFL